MRARIDLALLSLSLVLSLAFGAPSAAAAPEPKAPPSEDAVVVFAAASLREAFTAFASELKRAHPGVTVTFNFAGSQELRTQLEHGAAADVVACADARTMDELARAKLVGAPALFARNTPVVVVAPEAVATVKSFAELPRARRIVIGTPEVPIGRYTGQILERADAALGAGFKDRVLAKVASRELNVKQVLAKVKLGEADAGIVYNTDARTAPELGVLAIPAELNVIADYPLALSAAPAHPTLARAFVALVRSPAGQAALAKAGFAAAPAGS